MNDIIPLPKPEGKYVYPLGTEVSWYTEGHSTIMDTWRPSGVCGCCGKTTYYPKEVTIVEPDGEIEVYSTGIGVDWCVQ